MKVEHIMSHSIDYINPNDSIYKVSCLMKEKEIGCLPVCYKQRVIGLVTDRDIVLRGIAKGYDIDEITARDVMTSEPIYCYVDDEVDIAIHKMGYYQIRRLVVLGKNDKISGMLSLADLSKYVKTRTGSLLNDISEGKYSKGSSSS